MPRKHTFILVVLLGAAAIAGLLAMTRTAALGNPAKTSPSDDGAISFRMQELDRLEASLRKQLAARSAAATRATVLGSSVPSPHDDHEDSEEHGEAEHVDPDDTGSDDGRDD